jgi:hypothetical protein
MELHSTIFLVGHCNVRNQYYVSTSIVIYKLSKAIANCINRRAKENSIQRHA